MADTAPIKHVSNTHGHDGGGGDAGRKAMAGGTRALPVTGDEPAVSITQAAA